MLTLPPQKKQVKNSLYAESIIRKSTDTEGTAFPNTGESHSLRFPRLGFKSLKPRAELGIVSGTCSNLQSQLLVIRGRRIA